METGERQGVREWAEGTIGFVNGDNGAWGTAIVKDYSRKRWCGKGGGNEIRANEIELIRGVGNWVLIDFWYFFSCFSF